MTKRFDRLIKVILKHEGGYVNDPDDAGGETNFGISKRQYPDIDIKNLTVEQAKAIYYEDYYLKMRLNFIQDDELALHLFDSGVNVGPKTAVQLLQELFPWLKQDGVLGPITALAINTASQYISVTEAYKAQRVRYYATLALSRSNEKFLRGWRRRVELAKLD